MKKIYLIGAVIGAVLAATVAVADDPGTTMDLYDDPGVITLSMVDGSALDYGAVLFVSVENTDLIDLISAGDTMVAPDFSPLGVGDSYILSAGMTFSSAFDGPEFDYGSILI